MKKEQYLPLVSFLSSLFLYLGISFLPIQKWIDSLWIVQLIRAGICLILLFLLLFDSRRLKLAEKEKHPSYLLVLPFLLLCCSNFLYVLFFRISPSLSFNTPIFFTSLILVLVKAGVEELLFRKLLLSFLLDVRKDRKHKELLAILIVSLCFSLRHAVNFYGNDPLSVFSQIGYTFFLSLFLTGYTIFYSSLLPSYSCHFLFNLLNKLLFSSFYEIEINPSYILFSIRIGFLLFLFYLLFGLVKYRKTKKHA